MNTNHKNAKTMEHRGHHAVVSVRGISGEHMVAVGKSVTQLREKFEDLIDWYLEECEEKGIDPAPQASGVFQVRVDPGTHTGLTAVAAGEGVPLNRIVGDALREYLTSRQW